MQKGPIARDRVVCHRVAMFFRSSFDVETFCGCAPHPRSGDMDGHTAFLNQSWGIQFLAKKMVVEKNKLKRGKFFFFFLKIMIESPGNSIFGKFWL